MPGDAWRLTDIVTVPDVVGLPMEEARKVASAAGVVLTQPDSDGPPLAALTWPGDFLVTGQTPGVGTRLWRWDSVVVSWRAVNGGDGAGVREPRRPIPSQDTFAAPLPESETETG